MQAVTAWYYTPGVGASTGKPKANLVNYVETAASTFAVQQIGSTALLPSTKLLLIAQGPDVYVADLAWSFEGYDTSQLDRARTKVGQTRSDSPLADVADRLVRHDGLKSNSGTARGVLKTRFMPLDCWIAMVKYLSKRTPNKARQKKANNPLDNCGRILVQLGNKTARVSKITDDRRRAAKDAEHLEPLRQRFLEHLASLMARDDLTVDRQVVPAFRAQVTRTGITGLTPEDVARLFDQASEMALDAAPAGLDEKTAAVDAKASASHQNALHGLVAIVEGMAQVVRNGRGDALGHLFKKIATDSPFSRYLGAARTDASGQPLPPLQVTVSAMREASNDPRYRCFAGGNNAHVVKKRSDSLLKALKLLCVTVQKGGHLVDTKSWLDKVKRATANMGGKVKSREVPIRFLTVFPDKLNSWPACRDYLAGLLDAKAPASSHEVDARLTAMKTKVKVDGHAITTDMKFMTSASGRAGRLDALKWLWQLYSDINNDPTPAGFVQVLLEAPAKTDSGEAPALTFGECLIRAYLCWISRACLLIKAEQQKTDGVLPRGITASRRAKSQQSRLVIYGQPLSDLLSALEIFGAQEFWPAGPNSQPLRPAGMHALHGLPKLACARFIWEIGTWKIIQETGLRIGFIEMINICTKSYRDTLEPERWAGSPELRRGFWFVHSASAGNPDPIGNIAVEYNDSKTVGAQQQQQEKKYEKNHYGMVIRRAGTWLKPQFASWLPLFIDAYYFICGSIDRSYTSSVHNQTNHSAFEDLQCKNFVTPAMPKYQPDFAKLTQSPEEVAYGQLYDSQMGAWNRNVKVNFKENLAKVRARGAEPTLWPPRPHKWDLTGSTAEYNEKTSKWLQNQMIDHCALLSGGRGLVLRNVRLNRDTLSSYNFHSIDDVPCEYLGHPRAKKKSKAPPSKPLVVTKNTQYAFRSQTALESLIGHPLDSSKPNGQRWDKHRVASLQLTMKAVAEGALYPSCTFAGRQHNISVALGWQAMLLDIPHMTERHGAAELLQNDIDRKLEAEAHLGIDTVMRAYTKILQEIPLGHPTRYNDLIRWRIHGHPVTPAVWSTAGKLRVEGDESTRYYIESWPDTFVPVVGDAETDVWIRVRTPGCHQRLTIPEQNANLFFLSIVKFGIDWILKNQITLRGFKDGSISIFQWLDGLKQAP